MPRLPPRPNLSWTDAGAPRADDYADIYFSGDGLSETRAVFLDGCNLPAAWASAETFTVGELGFGSGLNLLALWRLWRDHRPSPTARLHFLSFEGFLMEPEDAARIHAALPALSEVSQHLLARWPARARGVQRIPLPDGVTLTIHIDEISTALPEAEASCDAWFLDGFAPARNPDMWSAEAMRHVVRLSQPGAVAATYTVAGDVRRNLAAAGFIVEKKPGHGTKRERLEARLPGATPPLDHPRTIAVIGAGIAGACAAHAFRERGCQVTLIDQGPGPGAGASGNPTALVMPRLDATDTPEARALIEAYLFSRQTYGALSSDAASELPAERLVRASRDEARFNKLLDDPPLSRDLLAPRTTTEAGAGYVLPACIAVRPATALPELIGDVEIRYETNVTSIDAHNDSAAVHVSDGQTIKVHIVILCVGDRLPDFEVENAPPITPRLGQLESIPYPTNKPAAITDGGYVVEAFGDLVFGSTFQPADGPPQVTETARAHNLDVLKRLRPDLVPPPDPDGQVSRAALRATTPDRLPFAGPATTSTKAPDHHPAPVNSLQLVGGLGARGFLWAPLLAELIAARAFAEPLPVEASVAAILDPDRFRRRAARRER